MNDICIYNVNTCLLRKIVIFVSFMNYVHVWSQSVIHLFLGQPSPIFSFEICVRRRGKRRSSLLTLQSHSWLNFEESFRQVFRITLSFTCFFQLFKVSINIVTVGNPPSPHLFTLHLCFSTNIH